MLLRPRAALGRRQGLRPTSHFQGTLGAHVERGSGRSETPPTAILQDTHSVEGEYYEVRPNAAREMKTARKVQGACVSVPYRRRHPRSSITGFLIVDCQYLGE